LKKKSRTPSPKASVATTSINPFTRSAGNPTAQAVVAPSTAPAPSAGTIGQPASTVSMPAAYAPTAKNAACAIVTWPVSSTMYAESPSRVWIPTVCARP
jgi:hypothetical protein